MEYRYDEVKATQAAAYLIKKYRQPLHYMKLVKLLYYANRRSLELYDTPIVPDSIVAMDRGPVLSHLLDSIRYRLQTEKFWQTHISKPEAYSVKIIRDPGIGKLSRRALAVLDEIDALLHNEDRFTISESTHELPEWSPPLPGSCKDISIEAILQAVGKSAEEIDFLINEERLYRKEAACFESLHDGLQGDDLQVPKAF